MRWGGTDKTLLVMSKHLSIEILIRHCVIKIKNGLEKEKQKIMKIIAEFRFVVAFSFLGFLGFIEIYAR